MGSLLALGVVIALATACAFTLFLLFELPARWLAEGKNAGRVKRLLGLISAGVLWIGLVVLITTTHC